MTVLTVGNKGTATGYLAHRLHANMYQFKKRVFLDKLTISSNGPSPHPARAIILKYSDIAAMAINNTKFDARSYAILTSNETAVTVNGDTVFTFPRNIALEPNVTYIIGVSFDNEASGNGIYLNTDLSQTSDLNLNADVMLKAEPINGGTFNHGTNYFFYGSGSPSFHSWGNQTFWHILDYSDAAVVGPNTYTFPNIPARLQVGDIINFPYTGATQLLNRPEIGKVRVDLYGAQGGTAAENSPGGYGGRSVADFYVRGKALYVNVGGYPGRSQIGGFNGGGTNGASSNGGGGGGATDVRLAGSALTDRVVVAGGGGGGGYENGGWTSGGGHGGGANRPGVNGAKGYAEGGQLTRGGNYGGILGQGATYGQNGASWSGNQQGSGAGGGGYYGGGIASDTTQDFGGGGGSGYADTTKCTNISGTDGGTYNTSSGGTGWSGHGKATITILELNANPPNTPPNISGPPIELNFNESIDLEWTPVGIPAQPVGTTLDVNKVFYETLFYPSGSKGIVMETGLETVKTRIRPIIGNLNGAKFGVRAYVLVTGVKIYSEPMLTQAFKVASAPLSAKYPNALTFDGISDYVEINQRVLPITGDFTWEGFFKTTAKKAMTIFHVTSTTNALGLKFGLSDKGIPIVTTKQGSAMNAVLYLNDGKLHHYAITRSGNTFALIIDGVQLVTVASTDNYTDNNLVILGDDATRSAKFEGVLGLPRFWTDVRTLQELDTFKNTVVSDGEQGLYDYMYFNPTTGNLGLKKGTSTATMFNGVRWSYMFNALSEIVLPYPDDFQRSENLDYLRVKVNELRANNGLPDVTWTDPFLIKGYTPIRAIHWNEIEDSILEVFDTIGQKINSQAVEDQFRQDIKPNDTQFPIKQLRQRINNIVKGLKND